MMENRTPGPLICAGLFPYLAEQAQNKQITSHKEVRPRPLRALDGRLGRGGRNSQMTNQLELSISYKPLWKLLIDKNLKRQDLREMDGLSGATIAKLGRNENVATGVPVRICAALGCQLHEVAELATTEGAGA